LFSFCFGFNLRGIRFCHICLISFKALEKKSFFGKYQPMIAIIAKNCITVTQKATACYTTSRKNPFFIVGYGFLCYFLHYYTSYWNLIFKNVQMSKSTPLKFWPSLKKLQCCKISECRLWLGTPRAHAYSYNIWPYSCIYVFSYICILYACIRI